MGRPPQVRRRLAQFSAPDCPPVIVTTAPLYLTKAQLLPGSTFVVGADTAQRLVMIKYYDNSESRMVAALLQIARQAREGEVGRYCALCGMRFDPKNVFSGFTHFFIFRAFQGCDFLVAGRLGADGRFITLDDVKIPPSLESMFENLPGFRIDISSTELRMAVGDSAEGQKKPPDISA